MRTESDPGGSGGEPPPCAVVDLDGTVADVRHRLHHLEGGRRDWDAFFAAAPDDPPLAAGLATVARLAADHEVVWLTGRPERYRADTMAWLERHALPTGPLLMRPDGDRRPARLVKVEVLRRLARRRRVALLVDDDPAVVAAARRAGFRVLRADWVDQQPALRHAQEDEGRT